MLCTFYTRVSQWVVSRATCSCFLFFGATPEGPGGGYHALGKMLIGLILQVTKNWLQALSDYTRASASPPARGPHEVRGRPASCRTSRHPFSLASLPLYGILQRLIKPSCFVPFLIRHPVESHNILLSSFPNKAIHINSPTNKTAQCSTKSPRPGTLNF